MKSPLIQNQPEKSVVQPQSSKKKAGNICFTIICWIVSISIWVLIGYLTVYIYFLQGENENFAMLNSVGYSCLGLYVLYLILEFCSPTARYLMHKRSNEGIKKKMGEIFKSRPSIRFHVECYHYETEHYTETDSEGRTVEKTREVKVTTHTETEYFDYYSVRDISGLLNLNCDKAQIERKCYIKLELKEEINFADSISVSDYESQKEAFKDRNRYKDDYMDFSESWSLPGITHHNLIKIGDYEPCTVNCCWYIIFTLFTLAQIYKWHVASFCVYQNYKIRKIISTRYNLNSQSYDSQYKKFNPQINLITLKIDFESTYYTYLNTSKTIQLPSKEELEKAKMYDNKVPKYSIYTESDGDIQRTGTVKDNPDFADFNTYQAPQVYNNTGVSKDQKKKGKKQKKNDGYNSSDTAYNSGEQGIGGGIYSQGINNSQAEGNLNNPQQFGGNIYGKTEGGNIYGQPPYDNLSGGGNIYGQQPGANNGL